MYQLAAIAPPTPQVETGSLRVCALTRESETEALTFLAAHPLDTVVMAGLIRDNGLVSPLNRGTFYACRDAAGELQGVALIGHITMVETRSEAALEAFALLAQDFERTHIILGEQERVARFWNYYAQGGQPKRLLCRELMFEQRWPVEVGETVKLRPATLDDIELVMPVHARIAFEECGVNPMEKDPAGFRARTERRIEQGRVWVWIEDGRLIFKADIISETPEAIYLEGIYVRAEERGKGYGRRCLSQLSRDLLQRTGSICLLVNEQNRAALSLYQKAGYKKRGSYDTIYLQQ
jgi:predicted GNAT family acetyltransferase